MSLMNILNRTGDTKLSWDKTNPDEVATARAAFNAAVKDRKMIAFKVDEGGKSGEQMRTFDPDAERILITPALRGG